MIHKWPWGLTHQNHWLQFWSWVPFLALSGETLARPWSPGAVILLAMNHRLLNSFKIEESYFFTESLLVNPKSQVFHELILSRNLITLKSRFILSTKLQIFHFWMWKSHFPRHTRTFWLHMNWNLEVFLSHRFKHVQGQKVYIHHWQSNLGYDVCERLNILPNMQPTQKLCYFFSSKKVGAFRAFINPAMP